MKRRRLVEEENARLRAELTEVRQALTAERAAHKADLDAAVVYAATIEARQPGMCPDLATCMANTDRADKWRRAIAEGWTP